MAERAIGKRQKEAAVLQLINKLIQKKTGKIYILDLDKTNNIPVYLQNKNEGQALAIAYYQLLTNCFTSSKKAKEQFKALFICDISKCNLNVDQKMDRRYRADKNMLVNGSSKQKQQIVNEYFNDCFKKLAARKQQTEQVLDGAQQRGDIGQSKEDEDNIELTDVADIHTDPDVPGGNITDDDNTYVSPFDGDGENHLDDEDDEQLDQNKKYPDTATDEQWQKWKEDILKKNRDNIKNIKDEKAKKQIKQNTEEDEQKQKTPIKQAVDRFTYKLNKYKKLLDI